MHKIISTDGHTIHTEGPAIPAPALDPLTEIAEANARLNPPINAGVESSSEAEEELEFYEEIDDIPIDFIRRCLFNEEAGDAALYRAIHLGKACRDLSEDLWYSYRAPNWVSDLQNTTLEEAFAPLISCYFRLQHHLEENGKLNKELGKMISRRISSLKKSSYRKVVREAASNGENGLGIPGEVWDADPYRMACGNGVINMRLGDRMILEPGEPEMYLRRRTPISLDCSAESPELFLRTLGEIFDFSEPPPDREEILSERTADGASDAEASQYYTEKKARWEDLKGRFAAEMIAFLQVLLGYSLIGRVQEHIIVILQGKGRNGKTLLVELLQHVLGEFAATVQPELLMSSPRGSSSSAPSPDLLDLMGKRLIFASETRESDVFDSARVKRLTGGDMLVARGLYARTQTRFTPGYTLYISTNHKPNASAEDFAFWQRVILISFQNSFVKNPDPTNPAEKLQDPTLLYKLKKEAPQILAWLVEGAFRYQEEGLQIPDFIAEGVDSYRQEVDLIGQFLGDCCILAEGLTAPASLLYQTYDAWCSRNGYHALGIRKFGERIKKRDFKATRRSTGIVYHGIEIRDEAIPLSNFY